jgi:hypothetical protein
MLSASRIHNFIITSVSYTISINIHYLLHMKLNCVRMSALVKQSVAPIMVKLILPAGALHVRLFPCQRKLGDKNDDQCLHTVSICIYVERKRRSASVCVCRTNICVQ